MAKLLDKIGQDFSKTGLEARTQKARRWLGKNIKDLSITPRSITANDKIRSLTGVKHILPGRMYFYYYDPKLKDTLPFYDKFPLTIPIEQYNDGFLGLNLHYLPVKYRLILLDKLYDLMVTNDDPKKNAAISYSILSGAARYKEFKPCLKRYLFSHISSKVINVEHDSWDTAVFLPVEQFAKKSAEYVQRLSVKSF